MGLAESLLHLLADERDRWAGIGVPIGGMIRALRDAIADYRKAEAAGDAGAMAAAKEAADAAVKVSLHRLLLAITMPVS